MKVSVLFLALFSCVLSFSTGHAQEIEDEFSTPPPKKQKVTTSDFYFAPQFSMVFPIFVGAGPQLIFGEHFETSLLYGLTPEPFASVIGSITASASGNSSYKDIVEAAFQNNTQLRLQAQYNFKNHLSGWKVGVAYAKITSTGKAGIDKVLYAATGANYTNLKNLLIAAGRSTDVDMDSKIDIGEVNVGYIWSWGYSSRLQAGLGIAKVLTNDVAIHTGLPNFEATAVGRSLISSTESEMESIVNQYGVSPIVSVEWSYIF